jgi:hypothetical protein
MDCEVYWDIGKEIMRCPNEAIYRFESKGIVVNACFSCGPVRILPKWKDWPLIVTRIEKEL